MVVLGSAIRNSTCWRNDGHSHTRNTLFQGIRDRGLVVLVANNQPSSWRHSIMEVASLREKFAFHTNDFTSFPDAWFYGAGSASNFVCHCSKY